MRLSEEERQLIKEVFYEVFEDGKIYLFGSRVDDKKKGGDIDLFIQLPYNLNAQERLEKKEEFLLELYERLGEQKIDILFSSDPNRSIERQARMEGIEL